MQKAIYTSLKTILSFLIIPVMLLSSCKKFVEIPLPSDQLTSDFVFTDDKIAIQTLTGIYSEMMNNSQQFSDGFTTFFSGMASDELYYYTPSFRDEFVKNQITLTNHGNIEAYFWNPAYRYIYAANKCIEGATSSITLSSATKEMILGEAKFIRGFCYFYLINFFGDVPLILSSDYRETQQLPRVLKENIYLQIINDLKEAQNNLMAIYPSAERTRPNKFAATALLARVYLYSKDWVNAEASASAIINSGNYSLTANPDNVFLKGSNETIWQLKPVNPSRNTWEGNQLIPSSSGATPTFLLTNSLATAFEVNDKRKLNWTKSRIFSNQTLYYPYKYKIQTGSTLTEYYVVLRLAEQYLIRAEARLRQNNIAGARTDLDIIRSRAGLAGTAAISTAEMDAAIEQERRIEFFAEWGHRWFDLKRTNRANSVLGALKPVSWQSTDVLWPIPQNQLNLNLSLTQNPGY